MTAFIGVALLFKALHTSNLALFDDTQALISIRTVVEIMAFGALSPSAEL